eukprot:CAMPEP_0184661650 /NCGR_PEP_ID=MMETSP0308-20130426/39437_1 /TAXON_ID=38269 /ORGANISM="Gloeochaete witrockiana, Strain SAG 46.84" /LENGTH=44 /DNA_ID= /DNA_START= /DNA_END= /DNA_ORIENTATION=
MTIVPVGEGEIQVRCRGEDKARAALLLVRHVLQGYPRGNEPVGV